MEFTRVHVLQNLEKKAVKVCHFLQQRLLLLPLFAWTELFIYSTFLV